MGIAGILIVAVGGLLCSHWEGIHAWLATLKWEHEDDNPHDW